MFLQEAAKLGDWLMVALHSDATVRKLKGVGPVQNVQERLIGCLGFKPVDEVVYDVPYVLTKKMLDNWKVSKLFVKALS